MSTEIQLKMATCIACRMRRKKCDRKMPICSSCEELNIPKELCVCPDTKLGLKSKNSKVTRDTLIKYNNNLREEQKYLESIIKGEPIAPDARMKLSQILNNDSKHKKHERNLFLTQKTENGYFGSSSWRATLGTTPPGVQFIAEINKVLRQAKIDHELKKNGTLDEQSPFPHLNSFRAKVTEAALGLSNHNLHELTIQLLRELETHLPPFDQTLDLIKRYFFINQMRKVCFIVLDETEFYKYFNKTISKSSINGNVQFNVELPGEEDKIPFIFLFTTMMTMMVFQLNQTYTHANTFNHMLIHELADILYHLSLLMIKSIQDSPTVIVQYEQFDFKLSIQIIQGLIHYNVFDRYLPHGRLVELEDDTMGHSLAAKRILTLMKGMNLNTNIDKTFKHFSKSYRESLQSLWIFMGYLDCTESFESGTKPKLFPHELLNKMDPTREKYRKSIYVFNNTLELLSRNEFEDPMKVVELIKTKLVPDIKQVLDLYFLPIGETMEFLESFDMDDLTNRQKFFELTETYSLQITLLSFLQTLYNICYKRLEEGHRFSALHKQYGLLTLKYGLLVFYSVPAFLKCLQRVSTHKNSIVFGILPAFFGTFPHIRLAFRRSMYFVGARVFDNFPVDKRTLFESIYQKHEKSDEELMREILARQNFQHFYTFKDLEDFKIDDDQSQVLNKFTSLNNYTYLILSMGKAFVELQNCLKTQYVNLSFVRLSPTFFKTMKICSVFLNNAFSNSEPQLQVLNPNPTPSFQSVPPLPFNHGGLHHDPFYPNNQQHQQIFAQPPPPPPPLQQFQLPIPQLGNLQHQQQQQQPLQHTPLPPPPQVPTPNFNQGFEQPLHPQVHQQIPNLQVPPPPPMILQLQPNQSQFNHPYLPIPSEAAQPPPPPPHIPSSNSFNMPPPPTPGSIGQYWRSDSEQNSFSTAPTTTPATSQSTTTITNGIPEIMDFESFFNTPGLYHSGNLDEFLSFIPRPPTY
ncbi:hypothetical protein BN7_728 [Wickerhamomyces ciferrii]|uniref:Zn(2)-C6 fungal-type domain-containing protein n=1 Tax=Wickerhamomyces ciferrii (strain ATCC 14091 / BCRC 22168 / CBS 111 / JCM 3599 / NBRC 0793 / NRRL Y-1031 F-60-10) TaxID=1206466 RepID=K0KE46_WICCF|nr:uncharacterized protein BN7_728 [Wickerhamomyces ciferrii]CCH41191.1 hypothetical protein BN7_728 [Wickerhamomyces ciferrii]